MSDGPLPYRQIFDVGLEHYGEFACSRSTLNWLQASGLPTDEGQSVHLQVVDQCVGGHNVIVKVWTHQSGMP